MKNLDFKSVVIVALAVVMLFTFTSGISSSDKVQFIPFAGGTGIYNGNTNTLYVYKMWNASLSETPAQIFTVSEDGSGLVKIK